MRVLVTGGTGLLGSRVCMRLLSLGAEPVAYDLVPRPEQLGDLASHVPVERGDVLDLPALLRALQAHHVEAVVHTAALLTAAVVPNPWNGIRINYMGTVTVLEAARLAGVRRVAFCSSSTVYDAAAVRDRPIRETDPVVPRSVYATTKLACEHTGKNYADHYGVEFAACRFALLYGPGPSQSGAASLWLDPLLRSLARPGRATVRRPAYRASEYVYAEDAARALTAAALAEHLPHHVYNVGDGNLTPFDEVLGIVRRLVPGAEIEVQEGPASTPYAEWAHPMDHSLAAEELGYRPEFPVPLALERYLQDLRQG